MREYSMTEAQQIHMYSKLKLNCRVKGMGHAKSCHHLVFLNFSDRPVNSDAFFKGFNVA
jgi:hypothetical protein